MASAQSIARPCEIREIGRKASIFGGVALPGGLLSARRLRGFGLHEPPESIELLLTDTEDYDIAVGIGNAMCYLYDAQNLIENEYLFVGAFSQDENSGTTTGHGQTVDHGVVDSAGGYDMVAVVGPDG